MSNDKINWQHVHRTQEGNPDVHINPQVQYWQEQLKCVNQKLFNLTYVTVEADRKVDLSIAYHRELNKIKRELTLLN